MIVHPTCGKSWSGFSRCHCSVCHETFSGLELFDDHRSFGECADPRGMRYKRQPLRLVDGVWFSRERLTETLPTHAQ